MGSLLNPGTKTTHKNIINNIIQQLLGILHIQENLKQNNQFQSKFMKIYMHILAIES